MGPRSACDAARHATYPGECGVVCGFRSVCLRLWQIQLAQDASACQCGPGDRHCLEAIESLCIACTLATLLVVALHVQCPRLSYPYLSPRLLTLHILDHAHSATTTRYASRRPSMSYAVSYYTLCSLILSLYASRYRFPLLLRVSTNRVAPLTHPHACVSCGETAPAFCALERHGATILYSVV